MNTSTSPSKRASAGARPVLPHAAAVAALSLAGTAVLGPVLAVLIVVVVGARAGLADARTGRIPNRLVAIAGVAALAPVAVAAAAGPVRAIAGPATGVLTYAGPLLVAHVVSPTAIGFGDVKLAAVSGAALGLLDGRLGMVAVCAATGLTAFGGLVWRRSVLPLGPGLAAGTALAVLLVGAVPR